MIRRDAIVLQDWDRSQHGRKQEKRKKAIIHNRSTREKQEGSEKVKTDSKESTRNEAHVLPSRSVQNNQGKLDPQPFIFVRRFFFFFLLLLFFHNSGLDDGLSRLSWMSLLSYKQQINNN